MKLSHFVSEPKVGASTQETNNKVYSAESMAIAVVLSIFFSLFVGFIGGYFLSEYRKNHRHLDDRLEQKMNSEKSNRYVDRDHYNSEPYEKQLNVVFNPLKGNNKMPNGNIETKVQPPSKVKKVYL